MGLMGINEVHTECGPTLAGALIEASLVDELLVYMAPKLMGSQAREMFTLENILNMSQVKSLHWCESLPVGEDMRLRLEPRWD